ncbi:hypothetical protein GCK32_015010 [Trichostrongylus colubriformis]|uniref:7TM GPCR serpentine receptor class x (Srx) domain-containing protein n=1 Tax=Trichostrongylus colubriformis TaxID=6319 RepID=A0AAN8F209_TRICO
MTNCRVKTNFCCNDNASRLRRNTFGGAFPGVLDCIQLVVHAICGLMIMLNFEPWFVLNKILGAVMLSSFTTVVFLYIFLSLNRLLFVVFPVQAKIMWTMTVTWVLLLLAALQFSAVLVLKLMPASNYLFDTKIANWITPDTDSVLSRDTWSYANYIIPFYVVVASICYAIIFSYVKIARRSDLSKPEKLATINTFVSLIAILFAFVYWTFILPCLKAKSLIANFFSLMVWVILNGANPFSYLSFNRRLQRNVHRYFTMNIRRRRIAVAWTTA